MDADAEWSDGSDDALKSGSATGHSDAEDVSNEEKKIAATNRLLKTDPVNAILDKIDAELGAMDIKTSVSYQTKSLSINKKPPTNKSQIIPGKDNSKDKTLKMSNFSNKENMIPISNEPSAKEKATKVDKLKDGEQYHSDLDSLAAEQIDEKFKEIMKKKRGGYLDDLNIPVSDSETVKTEDFEVKFKTSFVNNTGGINSNLPVCKSPPRMSPSSNKISHIKHGGYASDVDSIKTEDFEVKFGDMLIRDGSRDSLFQQRQVVPMSTHELVPDQTSQISSRIITATPSVQKSTDKNVQTTTDETSSKTVFSKTEPTPRRTMLSVYGRNPPAAAAIQNPPISSIKKIKVSGSKMDTDSVDETCREIERESARIQLEMGKERRANSPAHLVTTVPSLSASVPISSTSIQKTNSRSVDMEERTALEKDVKLMREALHISRLELRECDANLKETREKAENARTQLMLTEFKRHNAGKDLDRLNEELEKQKTQNQTFNEQIQGKLKEIQEFRSLGVSVSEMRNLKDENTILKVKSRSLETLQLERDELVHQLNMGKDDLFHEQKQARIQKEELQLEFESVTSQLEEVQSSRDDLQYKLNHLETKYRQLEKEKNEIIQQKSKDYDLLKERVKYDSRRQHDQELMTSQQEVNNIKMKVSDLEERNKEKDDLNIKLRDQNIELQQVLAKEEEARDSILQDHKRTLLNFRKETDSAMMQLRESLFLEKQTALENLREDIDQDRKESMRKNDEKLAQILTENGKTIANKNDEIMRIQNLMTNLEDERRQLEQKLQEEIHQQVTQAIERERSILETERDWALRRERESLLSENNRKMNEITSVLQQETVVKEEIKQQLKLTQQELEEQRNFSRQASKDKMVAVTRAKELMREQTNDEIERLKEKLREENTHEIQQFKESLKSLAQEVETLRSEKQQLCRIEREFSSTLDRTERTVINEINEECRRSASVLGISPRKVQLASFQTECPTGGNKSSKYRTPITSSLANLRACNEELRTHLYEIKQEIDSLRSLLNKAQKDKEESLEILRKKLEKEKSDELDHLKERLVREHITQMNRLANQYVADSVSTTTEKVQNFWKGNSLQEESAEYYIRRYEQEINKDGAKYTTPRPPSPEYKHINDLQQEEINRLEREIQKLSLNRSGNRKPPRPKKEVKTNLPVDKTADKLQYKLQQLDTEPTRLSSNLYSGSVPDLSNPALYRQVPLKARLSAERDDIGVSFSDRSKFNEQEQDSELTEIFSHPNQKLSEMNKLQNTLTNQNKELMELERAYNQLNRSYSQRSPSPSVHFRSTR